MFLTDLGFAASASIFLQIYVIRGDKFDNHFWEFTSKDFETPKVKISEQMNKKFYFFQKLTIWTNDQFWI